MATIKYYPYSKKGKCKVYVRISIGKKQDYRFSTGLTIEEAKTWNYTKSKPKKNSAENRNLFVALVKLEKHWEDSISVVERSTSKSLKDINSQWLNTLKKELFNETPIEDKSLLIPYSKKFVEGLRTKTYQYKDQRLPYKQNTIDKYLNFIKKLEEYQDYRKKKFKLIDVDNNFANDLINYFTDIKSLSVNTKGRYIKRLKTIIKDADDNGLAVNPKFKAIKGFEDENIVTFLTLEEIDRIIDTEMPNDRMDLAKDWLIIGCYTAQRISDLFRMEKSMIIKDHGTHFISFKQFKTGKRVKIPIHYKVEDVLEKYDFDFPPNIYENEHSNRSELSALMKKVCEMAGITKHVRGRYDGIIGNYPKNQLISNHSCRRSFASNFYGLEGWTTPMIMEITGHLTEKSFLRYIDKEDFSLSLQASRNFAKMKERDKKDVKRLKIS